MWLIKCHGNEEVRVSETLQEGQRSGRRSLCTTVLRMFVSLPPKIPVLMTLMVLRFLHFTPT